MFSKSVKSTSVMSTPVKASKSSASVSSRGGKAARAPKKKDVLPRHLKQDLEESGLKNTCKTFLFESSDDSISKSTRSAADNRKKHSKSEHPAFDRPILCSSDVWKQSGLSTPKLSKKEEKSQKNQVKANPHKPKTKKTHSKIKTSELSDALAGISVKIQNSTCIASGSELSDAFKRASVEYNRSASTATLVQDAMEDDVFVSQGPSIVVSEPDAQVNELSDKLESLNMLEDKIIDLPAGEVRKYIEQLEDLRLLTQHNAPYPLYVDLCRLLGVLKLRNHDAPSTSHIYDCAYLFSETMASTLRQIFLSSATCYKESILNGTKASILTPLNRSNVCAPASMDNLLKVLPKDYTVVQISLLSDTDPKFLPFGKPKTPKFVICHYQHNSIETDKESLSWKIKMMCLENSTSEKVLDDFEKILMENSLIMKKRDDKSEWWKTRASLNEQMKNIVQRMENSWLGCWKGLLLSKAVNQDRRKQIHDKCREIASKFPLHSGMDQNILTVLLDSFSYLSREQLSAAIFHLWKYNPLDEMHSTISKAISKACNNLPETERHPLVLLLDKSIQCLPWESLPILENVPTSRMPSLSILSSKCIGLKLSSRPIQLDCSKTFYILNPSGDLKSSQEFLEPYFKKLISWKGVTGRPPNSQEVVSAFTDYDLFIYCGHGSGRQYLEGVCLDKLQCQAAMILMGCSSGNLRQLSQQIEAYGLPLIYLMNGCPCFVGNLWDVTDRDIDRYTGKLFELFIPDYGPEKTATNNIAVSVSQARSACKMSHLVGAAPIVYGLPVSAKK